LQWFDIIGANTSQYTSFPIQQTTYFRCVASNTCNTFDDYFIMIEAIQEPTFSITVLNDTICEGDTTGLLLSASGSILGLQWQEWGSIGGGPCHWYDLTGETSPQFNTPPLYHTYVGCVPKWRCEVTHECGVAYSIEYGPGENISLLHAPYILSTGQPQGGSFYTSQTPTMTVDVQGSPPFYYQWQKSIDGCSGSWVDIPFANSLNYTTPPLFETSYYRCVVSNSCGEVESMCAVLFLDSTMNLESIDMSSSLFQLNVYPNPVIDVLNIHINEIPIGTTFGISIYDMYGKRVENMEISSENTYFNHVIDVHRLSSGVHVVVVVVELHGELFRNRSGFIKL
jgi:hypothetical protein